MKHQTTALLVLTLAMSSACSREQGVQPQKAQPVPPAAEVRAAERKKQESLYAAREVECAKKRDEAAFLKANGRDADVAENAAKTCYQAVADFREARMHLDDMFSPQDDGSYRVRFAVEGVNAEKDMVVFRNYRNAIWLVKRNVSDAALKIMERAEADWNRAKKTGAVVPVPAGTVVKDLDHHYASIGYQYAKRELVFTMTIDGNRVCMPYWDSAGSTLK
jgi:hypothetical protein